MRRNLDIDMYKGKEDIHHKLRRKMEQKINPTDTLNLGFHIPQLLVNICWLDQSVGTFDTMVLCYGGPNKLM